MAQIIFVIVTEQYILNFIIIEKRNIPVYKVPTFSLDIYTYIALNNVIKPRQLVMTSFFIDMTNNYKVQPYNIYRSTPSQ